MDWITNRLSRRDQVVSLIIAGLLPVHIGGYMQFFLFFPANILRFDLAQLLGIFGYFSTYLLLESTIVLVICILIGVITPQFIWKRRFPALLISTIIFLSVFGLVAFLVINHLGSGSAQPFIIGVGVVIALGLMIVVVNIFNIYKRDGYTQKIYSLADRLVPLIFIYLFFDLVGLVVVLIRNLT